MFFPASVCMSFFDPVLPASLNEWSEIFIIQKFLNDIDVWTAVLSSLYIYYNNTKIGPTIQSTLAEMALTDMGQSS